MDFIAMAEDIRGHFRIPKARLVPEMDARFQHFPHRDRHEESPQGLGHRPAATLVRAFFSGLHYVTSRSLRGRLHRYAMETCSARIDLHTVFALVPCAISLKKALKIRVQAPWMRRSGIHALLAFPSVVSGKPTEAT